MRTWFFPFAPQQGARKEHTKSMKEKDMQDLQKGMSILLPNTSLVQDTQVAFLADSTIYAFRSACCPKRSLLSFVI